MPFLIYEYIVKHHPGYFQFQHKQIFKTKGDAHKFLACGLTFYHSIDMKCAQGQKLLHFGILNKTHHGSAGAEL